MYRFFSAAFIILVLFTAGVSPQVRPVNDYGTLGLSQLLKSLNTTASIMMIGAHPDDEDSALLAYLARGENARTAYLSLTRGDGGQNIIGPELFESLGVIRTEELLQARRLDGAEQYFTRAFDYGFSKTLAEARKKWDEKVIICDTVRAIRTFRPLVVISRFTGTPADGHGQHQYSGYITPMAVKAAADPAQCTDAGRPWTVRKFYLEQGFGGGTPAPLQLNTGQYDPILGRTYFEIAMEGRSQHRSQGEGRLELHGDEFSGLNLVGGPGKSGASEHSPFDGLDTSITGIAALSGNSEPALAAKLADLQKRIDGLAVAYRPLQPEAITADLVAAFDVASDAGSSTSNVETKRMILGVQRKLKAAIIKSAGIQIDALVDRETVVPGEDVNTAVKVYFPKTSNAEVRGITLTQPKGWQITEQGTAPTDNSPGSFRREVAVKAAYFGAHVPSGERPTQPYWLEEPRAGDLFRWPDNEDQTLPFGPPVLAAKVKIAFGGSEIEFDQPVQYRYADPARGELRRDLNVVPVVTVDVDQKLLILPKGTDPQTRRIVVSVTNNSTRSIHGIAGLSLGSADGWKVASASPDVDLKTHGEKANVTFDLTIPATAKPGVYHISPHIMIGDTLASSVMNTIAYPHIQTHRYYTQADTLVNILDLKVASVRVGYIMGSGDDVPDDIRQMGLDLTLLTDKDLASGDLSRFDTIVVGIRASETRPDMIANNQRLLDFVRAGGTLIFQYQRPSFAQQNVLPFPATMGPRVVDENAKVTILKPDDPVFNFPNKITDSDFDGWVQERNLYNFNTFDANYVPLLESHDEGEPPNSGGLVVASMGKGKYVYCSYSFFRQLPAGVGGAYRLMANLLSLPKAGK